MDAIKWLWKYVKKYGFSWFFVFLLSIFLILCAFINPIILGRFVDDVIYGGMRDLLLLYTVLLISTTVFKEISWYLRQSLLDLVAQKVIKEIRTNLYAKLQSLDCKFFDNTKIGDLMSRLTMDTEAIRHLVAWTAPNLITQFFYIVIGFIVLFSVSPLITICLFSISPFIAINAFFLSKYIKKDFIDRRESNARLNTVVQENISGNRVVKAYAREDYEIEKFEASSEDYVHSFMKHVYTWKKYAPQMLFFVNMITVIFILVGGILVINNVITLGQFTTINGCLWCITYPMQSLGNIANEFQQFNASSLKIRDLENEQPLVLNRDIKKRETGINGGIRFQNVTFSYNADRVLKHINFSANPGDTIAIIGPTGSGKSTIINLLSRFYDPTYGTIYIDDINIKNFDLATLRSNISSAMQDVFLFSDTIKNNIAYGSPNATLDDVIRVAKAADAHSFIKALPDGYDTVVGERGVGLSGGQRQRISLARALLKNPAILILDDTTSALDMETEYSIQQNLQLTHKTKIIIAHRISAVRNADLILVLNQGNLIEWGTHDTLIKQNGYYKSVLDHQFGDFNKMPNYHIAHPAVEDMLKHGGVSNGR